MRAGSRDSWTGPNSASTMCCNSRSAKASTDPPARRRRTPIPMLKKDLGLCILILVVGAVVAIINPRFLSPVNLANTANLIGLFGMFSIGEGFVIITGGIDLSIGSVFALLGVIFIDLLVTYNLPWQVATLI